MQHPCIGYFLDPKSKVKSATMITDIVWGGKGREITYGFPILPNKYEASNVAASVMCVHVCALMSTQCLPDDTFISMYIYMYIYIVIRMLRGTFQ